VFGVAAGAQTFRGGINGTVTDRTGAAIANATVVAVQADTGASRTTTSSSGGEFLFQDLPLGSYTVTVGFSGFQTVKTGKVMVSAGTIYTLPVILQLASLRRRWRWMVGLALDTTTTTRPRYSSEAGGGHAAKRARLYADDS
jgi:hypothetical protein